MIQEHGTVVSEGTKSLQIEKESEKDEKQLAEYLEKEEEYRTAFLQIGEQVKALLKEASELVGKIHMHRTGISEFATSIDTRYKDLAQVVKQYRDALKNDLNATLPEFEVFVFFRLRFSHTYTCVI